METVCEWEKGQNSYCCWRIWGSRLFPLSVAKGEGPAGHPLPGSSSWLCGSLCCLDGDSASGALPSVAGEAPAQRLGLMEMALPWWRAALVPLGVGGTSRQDGSGVTSLWGCTSGLILFVLGLSVWAAQAWGGHSPRSVGWAGQGSPWASLAGLSSVTDPILAIYGDFSSSRESPMLPGELPWAGRAC